jgi:nicotinamide N-methyltransferase
LQGHVLYPTSICLSDYIAHHAEAFVKSKNVLELGAGGGLPSLVAALEGAKKVRFCAKNTASYCY